MTKKILITGKNSYIGRSFIEYCKKNQIDIHINELDVRGDEWKKYDFSNYDTVIHLAGIAHIKETRKNKHLYYEINRDLAIAVAKKAKESRIKHFIFMSTMSVYGLVEGHIDASTSPKPKNAYGDSKLQAEDKINDLSSKKFPVSILRPPMIYGPSSKGNYAILAKFAKKTKIFPTLKNKRSMLFIDNLSELLINLVNNPTSKIYHPQNREYVSTKSLVEEVASISNNKIYFLSVLNPLVRLLNINIVNKVFGNLIYNQEFSKESFDYQVFTFQESIKKTEKCGV